MAVRPPFFDCAFFLHLKKFLAYWRTTTWCAALPDLDTLDSAALRTFILSQHEQILFEREQLDSHEAEVEQLQLLIAKAAADASRAQVGEG